MIYKNGIEEVGVKSDDDENLKKAYEEALKNASEKAYRELIKALNNSNVKYVEKIPETSEER